MTARHASQRGAAALAVAVLLAGAMLLAALFANRQLVTEQGATAQQLRSAQAAEAAEAGVAWAIAQLGTTTPLGSDCRPAAAPAPTFLERQLATAPQPACVRTAAGWSCHCPAAGRGNPAPDADGLPRPGFAVSMRPGTRAGTLQLSVQSCMPFASPCDGAVARAELTLARLPGLAQPPAAALTVRGSVEATGTLGAHNSDAASGGLALHAGGSVTATTLRLTAPPGASTANAFLATDAALAAATPHALWASTFGVDPATWRAQPAVRRIACRGDCGDALAAAIGEGSEPVLLAVDGDLRIDGPRTIGTPARPVVLWVDGNVAFAGAVALHGLLAARDLDWNGTTGPGAFVRGAVVLSGRYAGNAAADIARDGAILDTLRRRAGSFVRLPGSWRDF